MQLYLGQKTVQNFLIFVVPERNAENVLEITLKFLNCICT